MKQEKKQMLYTDRGYCDTNKYAVFKVLSETKRGLKIIEVETSRKVIKESKKPYYSSESVVTFEESKEIGKPFIVTERTDYFSYKGNLYWKLEKKLIESFNNYPR